MGPNVDFRARELKKALCDKRCLDGQITQSDFEITRNCGKISLFHAIQPTLCTFRNWNFFFFYYYFLFQILVCQKQASTAFIWFDCT